MPRFSNVIHPRKPKRRARVARGTPDAIRDGWRGELACPRRTGGETVGYWMDHFVRTIRRYQDGVRYHPLPGSPEETLVGRIASSLGERQERLACLRGRGCDDEERIELTHAIVQALRSFQDEDPGRICTWAAAYERDLKKENRKRSDSSFPEPKFNPGGKRVKKGEKHNRWAR